MTYFNHFIIIILYFLIIRVSAYQTLKKYGNVKNTNGKVIFESKDFSDNDKMYFTIKIDRECRSNLWYNYYNTI